MALPGNNNSISLSQIQTEFGGTDPISLTEYYRGGSYTTDNNINVPTTGEISMSDFFGARNSFELTISTNQTNLNLYNYATAAGWNAASRLIVTINSGVYIYGTTSHGLYIGTQSALSYLELYNYGYILGYGGRGGDSSSNGSAGGTAISVNASNVNITNRSGGFICGGGGGGAGASGSWGGGGGGAGGGRGGNFTYDGGGNGGAGGGPGQSGSNGASRLGYGYGAGGEAGGQGGSGESNSGTDDAGAGGGGGRIVPGSDVRLNSGGNNNGWGAKGSGGGRSGGTGSGRGGGGGGGWGAAGGNSNSYTGGSGGRSISGIAQVTNQGTIYGDFHMYTGGPVKNWGDDDENEYDLDGNLA